jgi:hypothetical protein
VQLCNAESARQCIASTGATRWRAACWRAATVPEGRCALHSTLRAKPPLARSLLSQHVACQHITLDVRAYVGTELACAPLARALLPSILRAKLPFAEQINLLLLVHRLLTVAHTAAGMSETAGHKPWWCAIHGTVTHCPFRYMWCDGAEPAAHQAPPRLSDWWPDDAEQTMPPIKETDDTRE